ncbi:MAG TPA: M1 family aminopeptidase [Isosphaeraceae bacterium]|nr:M1 family aminopeptidase [Isosphaeraceae bacterium]
MRCPGRGIAWIVWGLALAGASDRVEGAPLVRASGQGVYASPQDRGLAIPAGLPRYDLEARLDLQAKKVVARERVRFTNRTNVATRELVFHVYPRYRVADQDKPKLMRTMEVLRLSPDESLDAQGRRLTVAAVRVAGRAARFEFDPNLDTVMIVPLARPVAPGDTVVAEIDFTVELPDYWGRWGHHNGITYLLNWYPVLAYHDAKGWERTPFVPWHQPWHQEAGHYNVRFDLPAGQVVASTGRITRREPSGPGRQALTIVASPARDFALVCSDRFITVEQQVGPTRVCIHTFPEDRANAERMLGYAAEVIPIYERWFGPYYDDEFEVAPSFFGWNGNECSGLVLIDVRVFRLPTAGARYLDHLITHETCHQWFWNVVGSDGYAETFMDEGLVNSFTALRLDAKYGRNAPLIAWPRGLSWLPTIGREDLRLAGYYGWRARGNQGSAIRDLKAMGDLNTLFSLAYDRGGKVIEMVHNRLGPDRFFAFWRKIYHEYAFETFRYADLKRELAAFDPGTNWDAFLDGWLVEHKDTDWGVERVLVERARGADAGRVVTVELKQSGAMVEPTVVLCRCGEDDLRVPIWPERGDYDVPGAHVARPAEGNRWVVTVQAPAAPSQVLVDPDHALLDAVPDNNRWKPEVAWRLTPLMTPLDEASQFQAYDRPSIVAGPFIDQYARGGFKVGIQRLDRWQVTAWAGTEPALREAIFGGQAALLHFPWSSWSAGVFYEEGLYNFYNDKRHSGGRAFLRYRFLETSSFLIDDQGFAELYFGTGYEFWPGDDGRPVFTGTLNAIGARYRLSTLFPYWDPVQGRLIEVTAEHGNRAYGSSITYTRVTAEYGIVRPLPDSWGRLSKGRIAFRVYGGWGSPDTAPLFRLGGGRRLRAIDLSQDTGSAVWLSTLEWRYPLWRNVDIDALDHVLGFRNLLGAVFYDVGQSFFLGRGNPVVHGVGVGLRIDTALFAFLERATLRIDLAQPIGLGPKYGPVLWFGLNQVF